MTEKKEGAAETPHEVLGLTGTDADFDHPAHDKSLGRDARGRPMLTIPRGLMVNEAP